MIYITEPRLMVKVLHYGQFRFHSELNLCLSPTLSFICWSRFSFCLYFSVLVNTRSFKEELDSLAIDLYSLTKKTIWALQNGIFSLALFVNRVLLFHPSWL